MAQNSQGIAYGGDKAFTTPDWRPKATTEGTSGVASGKATLKGKVNPGSFATTYRFEWGTKTEFEEGKYNNRIPVPNASVGSGTSDVSVEQTIEGLKGLSEYHYRLVAESSEGKTTGTDKSFTTPDWRPQIETQSATEVTATEAILNGRVNPNGFATTYRFEYGPTKQYTTDVPVPDEAIGSGNSWVEVSKAIANLGSSATYHFRVVATNAQGIKYGQDQTFKTLQARVMLCQAAEILCSAENQYPAFTPIKAVSSEAVIAVTIGEETSKVTCKGSALEGETGARIGEPLPISLSAWTLAECETPGGKSCTATSVNLPYGASLARGAELNVGDGGNGEPGWQLKCRNRLQSGIGRFHRRPDLQHRR